MVQEYLLTKNMTIRTFIVMYTQRIMAQDWDLNFVPTLLAFSRKDHL